MTADNGPQTNRTDWASFLSCVSEGILIWLNQEIALLISNIEYGGKSRRSKRKSICGRGGSGRLSLTSHLVDRTNMEHSGLLEIVRGPTFSKPVWWSALYLSLNVSKSTSSKIYLNIPPPSNNYVDQRNW